MNKIYILSYPRSGNTWIRYILEFLSKRPSQGYNNRLDIALGERIDIGVDLTASPIAFKSHKLLNDINGTEKLLVIIRDYKEAIVRHAKSGGFISQDQMRKHFIQQTEGKSNLDVDYIDVIETYDIWDNDKKLLIYYEDLITNPILEINKIINFTDLKESIYKDEFFNNYDKHKNNSIVSYMPGSHTKGNDLKFHSSSLSNSYIEFMTNHLKTNHNIVFNKYLKRYE